MAATTAEPDTAEPMDEDALLQQALAMSMAGDGDETTAPAAPSSTAEPPQADASMFDAYDEELQNAIKMSMAEVQPGEEPAAKEVCSCRCYLDGRGSLPAGLSLPMAVQDLCTPQTLTKPQVPLHKAVRAKLFASDRRGAWSLMTYHSCKASMRLESWS